MQIMGSGYKTDPRIGGQGQDIKGSERNKRAVEAISCKQNCKVMVTAQALGQRNLTRGYRTAVWSPSSCLTSLSRSSSFVKWGQGYPSFRIVIKMKWDDRGKAFNTVLGNRVGT